MLKSEVTISGGLEVRMVDREITIKGPKGELTKEFKNPHIKTKIDSGKIEFTSEVERKKVKAIIGTWKACLKNMIVGVTRGWRVELKLIYSHFPVKLKIEGDRLVIENFLGEKKPRYASIPKDVGVKIDRNSIFVSGPDKERVGQTAARIEQATKIKGYDKRVFQDGIYITGKAYAIEGDNEGIA